MRRLCCLLLCALLILALLPVPAARGADSLDLQVGNFLSENGLATSDFSLSYYNTITGETCNYNADAMVPGGSLWMLPLHMYYCEQEILGAFEDAYEPPEEEFTINGYTLKECRYRSLLLEDLAQAIAMRDLIGSHSSFKQAVNEAFGHLEQESLPNEFLTENNFSTHFWMGCLEELYLHPEIYDDLLRNYTLIQTADALAGGAHSYTLFQIRAEEEGYVTALATVQAPQPFLIACSVAVEAGGDAVLAQISDLICSYIEESAALSPSTGATLGSTPVPSGNLIVSAPPRNHTRDMLLWIGIALGAALGIALLVAIPIWIHRRRRDDIYYD